jgi:hypothetical protein
MKKKMITIWALMLAIGIIPMSCDLFCQNSCGCGPMSPSREFSIKDLAIGDLVIGTSAFSSELFYAIDQYYKVIEITGFEYLTDFQEIKISFSLINSVYACSPAPQTSIQKLTDLKIINKKETTLSNNNLVLEDQEITDRFLISNYPTTTGQTITLFLENDQVMYMGEPFYLRLNETISNETELNFDILVKLNDGQEFKFEDQVMKIK